MSVNRIASEIRKRTLARKPVIIAIEGFGGAGKSTFAEKLKDELGDTFIINIDDFIIKEKMSDSTKSNFDRQRLKAQVLLPIKNGAPAFYQRLDWESNTLSEPIKVPVSNYLIIEGVSSYHPDIEEFIDYKIWVEASSEAAMKRGSKRDKEMGSDNDHLWPHWTSTYQEYKNRYKPDKKADFIYDNSDLRAE